jgi:hypothetical protein
LQRATLSPAATSASFESCVNRRRILICHSEAEGRRICFFVWQEKQQILLMLSDDIAKISNHAMLKSRASTPARKAILAHDAPMEGRLAA